MSNNCQKHVDEKQTSLCETCNVILCNKCLTEHDFSHSIKSLQQMIIEKIQSIENLKITDNEITISQQIDNLSQDFQEKLVKCSRTKEYLRIELMHVLDKAFENQERRIKESLAETEKISSTIKSQFDSVQKLATSKDELAQSMMAQEFFTSYDNAKKINVDIQQHKNTFEQASKFFEEQKGSLSTDITPELVNQLGERVTQLTEALITTGTLEKKPIEPTKIIAKRIGGHLFVYDIQANQALAKPLPDLLNTSAELSSEIVQVNDMLYFVGGKPYSNKTASLNWKTWVCSKLDNLKTGRYLHGLAVIGGKTIYCIGGCGEQFLTSCEKYNILDNKWTTLPVSLTQNKGYVSICTFEDKKIYCFGGYNTTEKKIDRIEMLNTSKEIKGWRIIDLKLASGTMWIGRYQMGCVQNTPTSILLFGGCTNTIEPTTFKFSVKKKKMEQEKSQLNMPAIFTSSTPVVCLQNGNIYSICSKGNLHIFLSEKNMWATTTASSLLKKPA